MADVNFFVAQIAIKQGSLKSHKKLKKSAATRAQEEQIAQAQIAEGAKQAALIDKELAKFLVGKELHTINDWRALFVSFPAFTRLSGDMLLEAGHFMNRLFLDTTDAQPSRVRAAQRELYSGVDVLEAQVEHVLLRRGNKLMRETNEAVHDFNLYVHRRVRKVGRLVLGRLIVPEQQVPYWLDEVADLESLLINLVRGWKYDELVHGEWRCDDSEISSSAWNLRASRLKLQGKLRDNVRFIKRGDRRNLCWRPATITFEVGKQIPGRAYLASMVRHDADLSHLVPWPHDYQGPPVKALFSRDAMTIMADWFYAKHMSPAQLVWMVAEGIIPRFDQDMKEPVAGKRRRQVREQSRERVARKNDKKVLAALKKEYPESYRELWAVHLEEKQHDEEAEKERWSYVDLPAPVKLARLLQEEKFRTRKPCKTTVSSEGNAAVSHARGQTVFRTLPASYFFRGKEKQKMFDKPQNVTLLNAELRRAEEKQSQEQVLPSPSDPKPALDVFDQEMLGGAREPKIKVIGPTVHKVDPSPIVPPGIAPFRPLQTFDADGKPMINGRAMIPTTFKRIELPNWARLREGRENRERVLGLTRDDDHGADRGYDNKSISRQEIDRVLDIDDNKANSWLKTEEGSELPSSAPPPTKDNNALIVNEAPKKKGSIMTLRMNTGTLRIIFAQKSLDDGRQPSMMQDDTEDTRRHLEWGGSVATRFVSVLRGPVGANEGETPLWKPGRDSIKPLEKMPVEARRLPLAGGDLDHQGQQYNETEEKAKDTNEEKKHEDHGGAVDDELDDGTRLNEGQSSSQPGADSGDFLAGTYEIMRGIRDIRETDMMKSSKVVADTRKRNQAVVKNLSSSPPKLPPRREYQGKHCTVQYV